MAYNAHGQLSSNVTRFTDGTQYNNTYAYHPDGTVAELTTSVMDTEYNYDALGRLSRIDSEINVSDREYIYQNTANGQATTQVGELRYPLLNGGYNFTYIYDNRGNISTYGVTGDISVNYNEAAFTYTYDSQGQLLSATDGTWTFSYTYDNAGNILTANGHTYTYGDADWGDLLTAYDGHGITYDAIGNPTVYYNGTDWEFAWKNGRELATARVGNREFYYIYDGEGLRTNKVVDNVVYTYTYIGSQLVRLTYGDNVLDFFYNANGTPIAMRHGHLSTDNYAVYYYVTNLQGDVIRLVDANGNNVAYYEYDPYGHAIKVSGSHANINPLRYRGYVYDTETGLYYLQSRYYDPAIGRFINADDYITTGQGLLSNNTFVYCKNSLRNHRNLRKNMQIAVIFYLLFATEIFTILNCKILF